MPGQQQPAQNHQTAADRGDGSHEAKSGQSQQSKSRTEHQAARRRKPACYPSGTTGIGPKANGGGQYSVDHLVLSAGLQQLSLGTGDPVGTKCADGDGHSPVQGGENDEVFVRSHDQGLDYIRPKVSATGPRMNSAARVSLQYALLFGTTGVVMPFAALWLASTGMTGAQIGLLLALPMVGRLATGPLLAVWADGFKHRKTAIALLGLAMAAGYGGAALVDSTLLRGAFWFIGATACAAIIPLVDVLTLRVAKRDGYPFSLPRGFGSLAFVMANVGMGALLTQWSEQAVIVWIVAASTLCTMVSLLVLPALPVTEDGLTQSGRERFRGLGRLLKNRTFMAAVLGVGAIQAAHGFYYSFSAILWKQQGIPESTTGLLWAFAVAGEIVFMWLIDPWRRKIGIGPFTLVIIGGMAAVARWLFMAGEPAVGWLLPLQALHAFTFAAVYLGSVEIVDTLSPRQDHTSSQTLASMLSSGLMTGLATAASGPIFDRWGGAGYLPMAGLAVVGVFAVMAVRAEVRRGLPQIAEPA